MTATASISPPSFDSELGRLHDLCAELSRRGWPTRLARWKICGEVDIRLQVGAFGARVVELLGPCSDRPCDRRWQAVRIQPDSRVVWNGPPRSGSRSEAVRFVEELLTGEGSDVAARYQRLG